MLFADVAIDPLDVGSILLQLFGGLALFLFGMDQMADALKLVAGDGMKRLLAKLTTNRFTAAIAGAIVTAVIQSSSVTTVLIVGFISAKLMTLAQSVGVIMGANIGTTITAQIIAFKITKYALLMVAVGFGMLFCFKQEKIRHYGNMIMGLGLIFFGMQTMSDGTSPLRTYEPFIELMQRMDGPMMAIGLAALFTALVQSSSATTGIVIVLASQGFISLEAGIALIFGANLGTCITALLAAMGKPREAVRAAVVHVMFNLAGVAIWYPFIGQLAELVTWMSPAAADLSGAARLAAETPRQIANAHTVFNIANTVIFIWFTNQAASIVRILVPDRKQKTGEAKPALLTQLDVLVLQTPSLALDIVRSELGRLGVVVVHMARESLSATLSGTEKQLRALEEMDNDVDALYGAIVTYMGQLSKENLTDRQSLLMHEYLSAANYLESIGDMVETNMVSAGRNRIAKGLVISTNTREILDSFHHKVCWCVERAVRAFIDNDREAAIEVMAAKSDINRLADDAEVHLSQRLSASEPNRLAAFRLESEIIEYLKRVYYFAKRIAKIIDAEDRPSPPASSIDTPPEQASVSA